MRVRVERPVEKPATSMTRTDSIIVGPRSPVADQANNRPLTPINMMNMVKTMNEQDGPVTASRPTPRRAASPSLLAGLAGRLSAARTKREPIPPLQDPDVPLTIDDAYAIQQHQLDQWIASGSRLLGHKVGLTSASMQRQLGVEQPDFGNLMDDMFFPENVAIPARRFLQPRIEPEIAFVLSRPLRGPGVTVAEAIRAVEYVVPALELIDSRIADWKIGIVDTIADNASSGGVVLGSRPVRLDQIDLRLAGCVLHRNGELAGTGAGGAVLGSPINALVWLANVLGERGVELGAGEVVLPGSMTAAIPFNPGDVVTSTVAGLGSVTARMGDLA
ncbi:2-keto-4-pentenoate hydratase [Streptosporangium lutulentum]|uniref:2-keto-4-pentenoate hydratase n=1 Tax=Streptosporangium lutulentum TaxID=1461250 RepID=A0ABT9QL65_9ACTN|nr:2-keto-4-pentenoate hydratase [Streptosporangium lutulentum]MDP9847008.1 2-keto-4-pentenoate hydratase [Streptosporangium lutulentum]